MYEVECKYRIADVADLERRLASLGCRWNEPQIQTDTYLAHPVRDFAQTDEALRIRRAAGADCITYKGPKLDGQTKTRRELEIPLGATEADADTLLKLFLALGFRPVADVRKTRRPGMMEWRGRAVDVSFDTIAGLGEFVELESLASETEVATVRENLLALAAELGLREGERRSYLELLLEHQAAGP